MNAHTPYLIALSVTGRRCVVIGGEEPALAKVRMLLEGGADVSVVAEYVHMELRAMESTGRVRWLRRAFRDDDLSGCFLAINTVFDAALQRRVWRAADARGVLLNTVDNPELCHYASPALVRRGPLQVAVSTAGESPFLAAALRERLERLVGPEWGQLTGLIGTRELRIRSASHGWVVKAILAGGRDLLDTPIEFNGDEQITGVEIVLTHDLAELSGTAGNSTVLVFPEDAGRYRDVRRLARWVRPNQDGRFLVDDLLPGTYFVLASDDVDDAQWANADYLEQFRSHATRVTLRAGERKSIALPTAANP